MPKQVQLRRGTAAEHATFTGAPGEVTYNTDTKALHTHDGATAGGVALARDSVVSVKNFGAAGNGATDDRASLLAAQAVAGSGGIYLPAGAYRVAADATFTKPLTFAPGASLTIDVASVVTINGAVYAGHEKLFYGSGSVAGQFGIGDIIASWFGLVADGTPIGAGTDNAPSLIKAIAIANNYGASPGGWRRVLLPAGYYAVASRIDVPSGVRLVGAGAYATNIYPSAGFNDANGVIRTIEGGHGQPPGGLYGFALSGNAFVVGTTPGIQLVANASTISEVWIGGFAYTHLKCQSTNQIVDRVVVDNGLTVANSVGIEVVSPGVQISNCCVYGQQTGLSIHDIPSNYGRVPVQVSQVFVCNPTLGGYGLIVANTNAMPVRVSGLTVQDDTTTGYSAGPVVLSAAENTYLHNVHVEFPSAATNGQKAFVISGTSTDVVLSDCGSKNCYAGVDIQTSDVTVRGGRHRAPTQYGISISGGGSSVRNVVDGVTVLAAGTVGVSLSGGADSNCIQNCVTHLCATGLSIVQNTGTYNALKNCHSVSTVDLSVTGTATANLIKSGNTNRVGAI